MAKRAKAKSAFEKLPFRVRSIIKLCRTGQRLCRSFRVTRQGKAEEDWTLEPAGYTVSKIQAKKAVASGFLVAGGDGLFGDEFSQTYSVKP